MKNLSPRGRVWIDLVAHLWPRRTCPIDHRQPADRHTCYPSLANCMVGMRLGFKDLGSDVFDRTSVPPNNIETI